MKALLRKCSRYDRVGVLGYDRVGVLGYDQMDVLGYDHVGVIKWVCFYPFSHALFNVSIKLSPWQHIPVYRSDCIMLFLVQQVSIVTKISTMISKRK